jgi:hypothetical protein
MVTHLLGMGVPAETVKKLSQQQIDQMFKLTNDPAIFAKASEKVEAQNSGLSKGFEGRSVDGSAVPSSSGLFSWVDQKDQAVVEVRCPPNTTETDVIVQFESTTLSVCVFGKVALSGSTFQDINISDCTWRLEDELASTTDHGHKPGRKLTIVLVKQKPMRWLQVIRS